MRVKLIVKNMNNGSKSTIDNSDNIKNDLRLRNDNQNQDSSDV
jgi:hypothetical protein